MSDRPVADPGVQLERTTLSWQRTALLLAVNAALVLRTAVDGDLLALCGGLVVLVMALALWVLPLRSYRRLAGRTVPSTFGGRRAVPLTVAAVAVASLVAAAAVVL
ncbi:DUF202 domain-containing protein [Nocardiopsis aegyptia]|uniref:Uncharacterized membrane protein YidH (DUF202 family) n=1 Tax=Nocardiopsis aegyptia TaxID=220378 RepID=A0A7Z0EJB4_9ACTN|nr:DUF202 domain-containing protein [Nocardiopsis aegyptia]NYJ32646.1 uncharacterized membrane protein YidH (DUF202 family) [Nocardiopsis aegyptia]